MYIIFSPTKTIKQDCELKGSSPKFLKEFKSIKKMMQSKNLCELEKIYKMDQDKIEKLNLFNDVKTCAIHSYFGLTFKQLELSLYNDEDFAFLNKHLRILSAAYGVLKPLDSIEKYRLDLKMKFDLNLVNFWQEKLTKYFKSKIIIDLSSQEYSELVNSKYKYTVDFLCFDNGKYIRKATLSKMMRGKLLNEMILNKVDSLEDLKKIKTFNFEFFEEKNNVLIFRQKNNA